MAGLKGAIVPVTPFQQNCTILWDEDSKQAAVIDPGGEVDRILEMLDRNGLKVERILLTHGHMDHAGGAAGLQTALRERGIEAPIEGPHRAEAFLLAGIAEQGRAYGMTDARAVTPDRWLDDGDTVALGPHRFAVLHCPGHTPGHVVYVSHEARFAVVGDVLFQGSVGRSDFPYGDPDALIASIVGKLMALDDDYAVISGHGPGSSIGAERRGNPFLQEALRGSAALEK